jgi:prevent-host-death family protein
MYYVSATDAKQSFAATIDLAQREPVVIQRQSRDVAVLLSAQDYERMRRTNLEDFQAFRKKMGNDAQTKGLTEDKLTAILATPD